MSEDHCDEPQQESNLEPKPAPISEPIAAEPQREPEVGPSGGDIAAQVEAWWNEHIHGSIVGRNTEILNYLRRAVEALKRRLCGNGGLRG